MTCLWPTPHTPQSPAQRVVVAVAAVAITAAIWVGPILAPTLDAIAAAAGGSVRHKGIVRTSTYDAIFIDSSIGLVRFVQITRANSHALKLEYFYKFINKLLERNQSFQIHTVQIVFVVLKEQLADFYISETSGEGLLAAFGWDKGKEKERVQIVGMNGWY